MKKLLRNLLLSLIVVLPFNAMALTYNLGTPEDGGTAGTKHINITVSDTDGVTKVTDSLSCSVTGTDNSCIIESLDGFTKDGTRISKNNDAVLADGDIVGRIVITNKSYESVKADVFLKYGESGSVPKTNITIGAAQEPLSDDATLHKLGYTPDDAIIDPKFESGKDTYTIYNIGSTNRRITFNWECDKCSVELSGGASTKNNEVELANGENTVKLLVRSQSGNETKTYTFTVIRGETTYNSNKLKSLYIGEYALSPEFNGGIFEYEVKIPKKISNIENLLKYEAEDSKAEVKIEGANKLDNDENTVKITVTGRDGNKSEYKIKVVKEDVEEIIEVIGYKDNKVSFMNVEGTREELSVEDFKTKYPSEWEKIDNNTYKFDENGNIIKNEDKTNEEPKKDDKKASFPWLIVVLIVLAIIIIGVSGFFIFRDSDKDDKDKKDDGKKEEVEEIQEPTPEEQEHLEDIDSYNEEARLIAEENLSKTQEVDTEAEEVKEPTEEVVKEEVIDEFVSEEKSPTMDIDEALSDLMNTKEYNFKD